MMQVALVHFFEGFGHTIAEFGIVRGLGARREPHRFAGREQGVVTPFPTVFDQEALEQGPANVLHTGDRVHTPCPVTKYSLIPSTTEKSAHTRPCARATRSQRSATFPYEVQRQPRECARERDRK